MCWRLRFQPKYIKIQVFLTKCEASNRTDEIGLKLSFLKADEIGLAISRVCRQTPNSLVPSTYIYIYIYVYMNNYEYMIYALKMR